MKRIALALVFSLLPLIAHAGNAKIAALVAELSKNEMWENGWYDSASDMPRNSRISDVLDHYFIGIGIMFNGTPCKLPYEIIALEKVLISNEPYIAVLVDGGFGQKIVLIAEETKLYWAREFSLK